MINPRSLWAIINEDTKKAQSFAPLMMVLIKIVSLSGMATLFAYLLRIKYIPHSLPDMLLLAPYIFLVGFAILMYVFVFSSAPGIVVLSSYKDIKKGKNPLTNDIFWIFLILTGFLVLIVLNSAILMFGAIETSTTFSAALNKIGAQALIVLVPILINVLVIAASSKLNERLVVFFIKMIMVVVMFIPFTMPGYASFVADEVGIRMPNSFIVNIDTGKIMRVNILFLGSNNLVFSPIVKNKADAAYVVSPRKNIMIASSTSNMELSNIINVIK